jgi:hypothetical protein
LDKIPKINISKLKELKMNIDKALDKAFEKKSLKEIADAPVDALEGVSEGDAELLKKAFNVKTIRDLANLKYVKWAQAIVTLSETES